MEIFRKCLFFRWQILFIEIKHFGNFSLFNILSYLMYNLSEWHRGTPTVPPVGLVSVPPILKTPKIHVFEDIWGTFSLYMSQDLRFVSRWLQILWYLQSEPSRFLDSSISKTIGSYEFIFRKQSTLCMNIHENNVFDDDSDDFYSFWWDL